MAEGGGNGGKEEVAGIGEWGDVDVVGDGEVVVGGGGGEEVHVVKNLRREGLLEEGEKNENGVGPVVTCYWLVSKP